MTERAAARINGITAEVGPAPGSAWQPARAGLPRALETGSLALVTLPTSPFWARRYTRTFLDSCRGIGKGTAETAELLVSELVTNAVRFAGDPARTLRYSERANAGLISLSLRHFREGLLIEVYDTDDNPPVLSGPDDDAESGRGLILVNALSKEWSYFFPPGGGKVVYWHPGSSMTRSHDVSQLTTGELELTRRQLRASLALIAPGSPAHVPVLAHIQAIDAELAGRTGNQQPGAGQRHDSQNLPGPPPPRHPAG